MRKIPWNKIATVCAGLTILIAGRAAVTIGRARYWHQEWLPLIREDPWIYIGFAAAAIAIIAWTVSPQPEPSEAPEAEVQPEEAQIFEELPQIPEAPE